MGVNLKKYLLVSEKKWHDSLFIDLQNKVSGNWFRCSRKSDFNLETLEQIKPDFIFIPHWSYIIPGELFSRFNCIVFHMTDLPYGRGGSPLQNLIVRGHKGTMISAIKVTEGIDSGPVYLKKPLGLSGTAREIFLRANDVISEMIVEIIEYNPEPQLQHGEVVIFKRRLPEESNMESVKSINEVYDYIRMLDAEGYPHAYIEINNIRFEFTNPKLNKDVIEAHVRIIQK